MASGPVRACYVTILNPNGLAATERRIYAALAKLPSGAVFQGRSIVRDVLLRLNQVQDEVYFHSSPQSGRAREEVQAEAGRQGRTAEDGQFSLWRLVKPAANAAIAQRWVDPQTIQQVVDLGPSGALLYVEYAQRRSGSEVPTLILRR